MSRKPIRTGGSNLLLEPVEFKLDRTRWGTWRRHLSEGGSHYAEFTSHARWLGLPLLHYTDGVNPATGRRVTARGVVAIGRRAIGVLAIGQAALGLVAIGQAGLGLVFGLGQAATGLYALGQLSLGGLFGLGQVAAAKVVIAQLGLGYYVLAQLGVGMHVWSMERSDPVAVEYFQELARGFAIGLGS